MSEGRRERFAKVMATIDKVVLLVAVIAVFSLLLDWGWGKTLSGHYRNIPLVLTALVSAFFIFENLARLFLSRSMLAHVRQNLFDLTLTTVFLILVFYVRYFGDTEPIATVLAFPRVTTTLVYLLLGQGYIVLTLVSRAVLFQKYLTSFGIRPAGVVIMSFAFTIFIGTVLLSSPHAVSATAKAAEGAITPIDAFFTATSAVCVTGLIVKDTGAYFSTFGQGVILVLIQIGGLGLMTFVAFSSLIIGRGIAIQERVVMQDLLSYDVASRLPRLITYILLITFGSEAVGVVLLYNVWTGPMAVTERLYVSIFHSISAFCNAGFSLFSTSFVAYRGSVVLNATVTGLIIFGGLGFVVQREVIGKIWYVIKGFFVPRRRFLKNLSVGETPVFLSLQTKIVLTTTGVLLLSGVLLFGAVEWNGVLAGMGFKEKLLAVWFQSVTPRTAGFNTVTYYSVAAPTLLLTIVLMFIGASPGSTGGGIKTSTFAILLANISSALKQRRHVEIMRRSVPGETSRQALMVAFLGMALVIAGVFVLGVTEDHVPFRRLLFEEVSAFGTVGLSTGTEGLAGGYERFAEMPVSLSAALSWIGKLVIIVTMFAGRIGPLTLVIAIAQKTHAVDYEYPQERVVIG